ncbi:phage antirepressor N-terminal domain-containing protein [Corynebacterium lubricantis]|uniref:phage antirepressor N-terminal domain-containing protein n=1 Tax=Corynebacterium lubricantis TaxID=541095 RepID=UPI00036AE01C|nr:phage antirepressor N-terminal domain-containing protein [Corynebacterium lubricantis]
MEDFGEVTVRATHDFHEESASIPILDSSASVEVLDIPFHRDSVQSVQVGGEPYVVFRPLVESIGLDFASQFTKLKGKSWATIVKTTMVGSNGSQREMTAINLKTLTMWLATIDEDRVNEASRPLVVAYQNEVAEAIESYWTKGTVINPRVVESQPQDFSEVISESRQQLELLKAAEGLIDPDHLRAKANIILARGLGEAPQLDPVSRPANGRPPGP